MAAPVATRELRLRMTLESDLTRGSAALQGMAKDAEKVETAATRANKAVAALGGVDPARVTPGGQPLPPGSGGIAQAVLRPLAGAFGATAGGGSPPPVGQPAARPADGEAVRALADAVGKGVEKAKAQPAAAAPPPAAERAKAAAENAVAEKAVGPGAPSRDGAAVTALLKAMEKLTVATDRNTAAIGHPATAAAKEKEREKEREKEGRKEEPKPDGEAAKAAKAAGGGFNPGAALAKVAGTVAAAAAVVDALAQTDNPLLTTRERMLAMAKAVPVLGDSLAAVTATIISSAERLNDWKGSVAFDVQQMRQPVEMAQAAARDEGEGQAGGLRRETRQAGFSREAVQAFPRLEFREEITRQAFAGFGPLSPAIGLNAPYMDPQMRAAEEARIEAQRGVMTAEKAATAAAADVAAQRAKAATAEADAARATARTNAARLKAGATDERAVANPGGVRGGVQRAASPEWLLSPATAFTIGALGGEDKIKSTLAGDDLKYRKALLDEQKALVESQRQLNELAELETLNKEKQLSLLQKAHELRKAETGLMKSRLAMLDEEAARIKSNATQFGLMNSVQQRNLEDAFNRFKKGGPDAVTAEELSGITTNGLTGPAVQKLAAEKNENNLVFKRLAEQTGQRDFEVVKREADKARVDFNLKMQLDEEHFAKLMEEQTKQLNVNLEGLIRRIVDVQVRKIENDARAGGVARGQ